MVVFLQGSVLEELQKHIRQLEQDKVQTQHEMKQLREKMEEMKTQLSQKAATEDTVSIWLNHAIHVDFFLDLHDSC